MSKKMFWGIVLALVGIIVALSAPWINMTTPWGELVYGTPPPKLTATATPTEISASVKMKVDSSGKETIMEKSGVVHVHTPTLLTTTPTVKATPDPTNTPTAGGMVYDNIRLRKFEPGQQIEVEVRSYGWLLRELVEVDFKGSTNVVFHRGDVIPRSDPFLVNWRFFPGGWESLGWFMSDESITITPQSTTTKHTLSVGVRLVEGRWKAPLEVLVEISTPCSVLPFTFTSQFFELAEGVTVEDEEIIFTFFLLRGTYIVEALVHHPPLSEKIKYPGEMGDIIAQSEPKEVIIPNTEKLEFTLTPVVNNKG